MNRIKYYNGRAPGRAAGGAFAALLALGLAPLAQATTGHMTLSADMTLTEDHTGTISLSVPGITLDCDGHTVQFGPDPVVVTSHVISAPNDGDVVRNCIVNADNATAASDAAVGISAAGTATVVDNTVTGGWTQSGIQVDSTGAVVSGNVVSGGTTAGHGFNFSGTSLTASDNSAMVNNNAGFRVAGLSNSTLSDNDATTTGFGGDGYTVVNSNNNVLERNSATGNANHGFRLIGSSSNRLESNVATGNTFAGIIVTSGSNGNTFEANTLSDNDEDGFALGASNDNLITGNTITSNDRHGVAFDSVPADGNAILSNVISGHTGSSLAGPHLGIELRDAVGFGRVTPNDAGDIDPGPNGLQNFPVLSAETGAGVEGTLDSAPNTTYTIEIFANAACSASRHGEGELLLGTTTVTTNASGQGSFSTPFGVPAGYSVSATATSPGNDTSEFSECMTDNCPDDFNPDQSDVDGDGLGDVCDVCPFDEENDQDEDGICESVDNCPLIANSDQSNIDMDAFGDACDDDIDGDNVLNQNDNCVFDPNTDQTDTDMDGAGDACDSDLDGDGVLDADDACLPTPSGEIVDVTGCAIVELCPCEHPVGGSMWKNHGAYVSCVAHAANDFVAGGLITETEKGEIVSAAGQSDCGHRN